VAALDADGTMVQLLPRYLKLVMSALAIVTVVVGLIAGRFSVAELKCWLASIIPEGPPRVEVGVVGRSRKCGGM
jgi:hypothetical protein